MIIRLICVFVYMIDLEGFARDKSYKVFCSSSVNNEGNSVGNNTKRSEWCE